MEMVYSIGDRDKFSYETFSVRSLRFLAISHLKIETRELLS